MSPLMVTIEKPDGSTAIISAQVGYVSDLVSVSKDFVILERCKHDPKNAKLGVEVGKYRCTVVATNRYIISDLTTTIIGPIPEIYVSFNSGIKAALIDFCIKHNYRMIENLTHENKKRRKSK